MVAVTLEPSDPLQKEWNQAGVLAVPLLTVQAEAGELGSELA